MHTSHTDPASIDHVRSNTTMLRWSAIFGGALLGLGLFAVLSTLFGAIAAGDGSGLISDTIGWWIAGSAIVSLFVGGMLAGWISGRRGSLPGALNGLTVWALFGLLGTIGFLPAGTGLAAITDFGLSTGEVLWVQFWSLVIGFATAGIGGLIGGALPQPTAEREIHRATPRTIDVRDADHQHVEHREHMRRDANGFATPATRSTAGTARDTRARDAHTREYTHS